MKLKRTAIIILACVILMGSILISSALNSHSYAPWFPALYMHLSTCKFSVDCASVQDHQVRFHITYDAKAEMFEPKKLPELLAEKKRLADLRLEILQGMQLTEQDLLPQYACVKCSDSGFLKNGKACDCYQKTE